MPYASDGAIVWREVEEIDSNVAHANWPDRFFARIVNGYIERVGNRGGRVGNASAYLIPAQDLYDFAGPIMQRTAIGRSLDP